MDESPFPSSSSSFLRTHASNKQQQQQYGSAYPYASPGLLLDESADFIGASNGSAANMSEINDDEDGHHDEREAALKLQNGRPGHDQVEGKVKQLQLDDRQQESAEKNNDVEEQQKQDGDDLQLELTDSERQEARAKLREDRLVQERDDLARMNGLLEQAIAGLQSALPRIERFQSNIDQTHKLLDTYMRIMSQTQHTQRLLLDKKWTPDKDNEEIREAAEAAERARREAQERIEQAEREQRMREEKEREEAERRAYLAANPPSKTRGRGGSSIRGGTRGRGTGTGVPSRGGIARGRGAVRGSRPA